ncbi:MAG: heparan-alpha-glucosaminide N-acetyltransferase domain-containing protein [Saprospiraceae bacterium]
MRLQSLDVFRGMTLALMLMVNNPGDWGNIFSPFEHADWHGCTLTDLVFPFFLFIVGVAVPYSLGKLKEAGSVNRDLYLKIGKRTLFIFLIGLALSGFPYYHFSTIRIPGVLARIAVVYGCISLIFLKIPEKYYWIVLLYILAIYWFLMTRIPVPGVGYANLQAETNLGAWLDYKLLHGHLWSQSKVWDPEGILSTLPAIGTGLLGVITGIKLRSDESPIQKLNWIFFMGCICLVIGYFWSLVFPLNKKIWTSSFVLFTGGLAMLTLASLTYLIDILKWDSWTKHFKYFGTNSLMVFVGSGIVARLLGLIKLPQGDNKIALKTFIYNGFKAEWLEPKVSSLLFAVCFMLFFYFILKWMYKKQLFWRM